VVVTVSVTVYTWPEVSPLYVIVEPLESASRWFGWSFVHVQRRLTVDQERERVLSGRDVVGRE